MANWGFKIKTLREERHWTQEELAGFSGVTRTLISRIEMGDVQSYKEETLYGFARAFEMSPAELSRYLHGGDRPGDRLSPEELIVQFKEQLQMSESLEIPCLGYVAAGKPVPAEQQDLGKIFVWKKAKELRGVTNLHRLFALRVNGNSLKGDSILDGNIVIVEQQSDFVDGPIYIVKVDDDGYVARHLQRKEDCIVLIASDKTHEDLKPERVEVIGRVLLFASDWRKPDWGKH